MKRTLLAGALALALCLGVSAPTLAAEPAVQVLYTSELEASPWYSAGDLALVYSMADSGARLVRYTGSGVEFLTTRTYSGAAILYPGGYTVDKGQIIDSAGQTVLERGVYDQVGRVTDGYSVVQKQVGDTTEYYLLNLNDGGSTVRMPDGAVMYGDGLVLVRDEKYNISYADTQGRIVLTPEKGWRTGNFSNGYACGSIIQNSTNLNDVIIDKEGHAVTYLTIGVLVGSEIPSHSFSGLRSPQVSEEGLVLVGEMKYPEKNYSHYGYMDMHGKMVIPAMYDSDSHGFRSGYAVVVQVTEDGKRIYGLIDNQGRTVIEPGRYQKLSDVSETGLVWAKDQDGMLCVLKVPVDGGAADPATGFTDVKPDDYFAEPVQWAVQRQITAGTGGGRFSPHTVCTRGEALTFLWRAHGSPEAEGSLSFYSPQIYFYTPLLWAKNTGIVDINTFSPSIACTRADMVTYLWALAGRPAAAGSSGFSDVPADADYAQAVAWAVERNITSGTGAASFSPNQPCTRAQIVTFLQRAMAE